PAHLQLAAAGAHDLPRPRWAHDFPGHLVRPEGRERDLGRGGLQVQPHRPLPHRRQRALRPRQPRPAGQGHAAGRDRIRVLAPVRGVHRRRWVAGLVASAALVAVRPAAARYDMDSPIALPAGDLSADSAGIRKTLEVYVRAVEGKDVQLFRTVKPNLSDEEEKRARAAFKSVQTQVVRMNVLSVDVKDGHATVKVTRRDTLNGSIVSSFPQTCQLAREAAGWTILDIGR